MCCVPPATQSLVRWCKERPANEERKRRYCGVVFYAVSMKVGTHRCCVLAPPMLSIASRQKTDEPAEDFIISCVSSKYLLHWEMCKNERGIVICHFSRPEGDKRKKNAVLQLYHVGPSRADTPKLKSRENSITKHRALMCVFYSTHQWKKRRGDAHHRCTEQITATCKIEMPDHLPAGTRACTK